MKKRFKTLSLTLAMILTFSLVLSACKKTPEASTDSTINNDSTNSSTETSGETSDGIDISEEVKIVMYLIGDELPDAPMVYEEVNKKLKADINATVECKYLSWADMAQKYSLVFAAGEDFDVIYTADWVYYAEQATKNAFMEVTPELVEKYMPNYSKLIPDDFWDQLRINDKVYMVPYLNKQVVGHSMILARGDLRQKYNLPEIDTVENLEQYMVTIAENETELKAYEGGNGGVITLLNDILYKQPNNLKFLNSFFVTSLDETSVGTVSYVYDDPRYIEEIKRIQRMAEAGCWSKNILAIQTGVNENFKAGTSAIIPGMSEQMIQYTGEVNTLHPEFIPEVFDVNPDVIHQASSAARSGMGINANSKNYERALMMLDLFGTDKSYYDLTTYGIEDVHYTAVGDNKMTSLPQGATNFPAKTNCPWGWERKDYMRFPDVVPDEVIEFEQKWIDDGIASTTPIVSFNFVDTNVMTEVAACTNIYNERAVALLCGMLPNVDEEVAKLKEDLKAAGIEKVQAEMQKQVTEYLARFEK